LKYDHEAALSDASSGRSRAGTLGITLCPGIWCLGVWWDGDPYSVMLTLVHLWALTRRRYTAQLRGDEPDRGTQ
jgi:hypothetical protein